MERSGFDFQPTAEFDNRDKHGFIKRLRSKLATKEAAPDPNVEKRSFKERVKVLIAKVALRSTQDEGRTPEPTEVEKPAEKQSLKNLTKKVGRRVLLFAGDVLKKVDSKNPDSQIEQAVEELKESKQHLKDELKELDAAPRSESGGYAPSLEREESTLTERRRFKQKSETVADMASTAILAVAGAGIFMMAMENGPRHNKEHIKNKKLRQRFSRFLERQQAINQQQIQESEEQRQQIEHQQLELNRLKDRQLEQGSSETTHYIHQVSELTERQAVVTHHVAEQLSRPEAQPLKPDIRENFAGAGHESAGTSQMQSKKSPTRSFGGAASAGRAFGVLPAPAATPTAAQTEQARKIDEVKKQLDKKVRSAWIIVITFAGLAVVTVLWIIQVIING